MLIISWSNQTASHLVASSNKSILGFCESNK